MKKTIITILVACVLPAGLAAQETKPVAMQDPREHCLMATGIDWARLGVDGDQVLLVNAIQSECLQDCVAAKESGGGRLPAVLDRHIAELRKVLSAEQFAQWSKWCHERHGGPPLEP